VLPNTSGLNAHYQPAGFARAFAELRRAIDTRRASDPPPRTDPVEPRRPS
jgi:TDG/mug DNA glycosylase family protein